MTKLILGLLSATMLWAATPDAKTEKEVLAALDAYKQALIARDAAALSKVLSDDLTYTHSSNKHEDKAAVLESLKGGTHVEAIDFKDIKTRLYGSVAVVTADADFRNSVEGAVSLLHLHAIHVFVKNSHGWQMVARQTTRYPEPAAAVKK
jgi:ketosteroid isomerase-like protein